MIILVVIHAAHQDQEAAQDLVHALVQNQCVHSLAAHSHAAHNLSLAAINS